VDQRVELDVRLTQGRERTGCCREHLRPPSRLDRTDVACCEVHGVEVEVVPSERVVGTRPQPVADHRDRPFAVGFDLDDHPSLRFATAEGRPNVDALPLELIGGAMAEFVVPERGDEGGVAGEPCELNSGDGAPAPRGLPPVGDVGDLAGRREMRHLEELRPLDMTDHRETERGQPVPKRWLEFPGGEHDEHRSSRRSTSDSGRGIRFHQS